MPAPIQAVSDAITQGGVLMIPFLALTIAWFAATSAELIRRPFFRNPAVHLLFPVGFVILAGARLTQSLHLLFDSMRILGAMDGHQLASDGLVLTRALTVILATAALSSFSALLILLWKQRDKT